MTQLALKDHLAAILHAVADDMDSAQSPKQQVEKSQGLAKPWFAQTAAELHAALRLADSFDINQMVSEYRALRASVIRRWTEQNRIVAESDMPDLIRFNEAIDQAVAESVAFYSASIDDSRGIFLGVLGHDLRNPLGAVMLFAEFLAKNGIQGSKEVRTAEAIGLATKRAVEILNNLLEMTRSAFSREVPITRERLNLAKLAEEISDEIRVLASGRSIELEVLGDTNGNWDGARLGQVFSNLLGNAHQYGRPGTPILIQVLDEGDTVVVRVHNDGLPIPRQNIKDLFSPMKLRRATDGNSLPNLGLGLFVASTIIKAHGGSIKVKSSKAAGTTFVVTLPRC